MKKIIYLLALSILLIGFVSCEEDEDIPINTDPYRIKNIIEYNNEIEYNKTTFYYEGDSLKSVIVYNKRDDLWVEWYKIDYLYNGDRVIIDIEQSDYYGTWYYYKSVLTFQNGLMLDEEFYYWTNENWDLSYKYSYQYSGSNLIAWQSFNGELEQDYKAEFIYENSKLKELKEYYPGDDNNWIFYWNEIYTYSGNNLKTRSSSIKDVNNNMDNFTKYVYSYSGSKISKRQRYVWYEEYWNSPGEWVLAETKKFLYNKNGYLIEMNIGESSYQKYVYEYEEGSGNAKILWYYPDLELVYGEPTLKSSREQQHVPYYEMIKQDILK